MNGTLKHIQIEIKLKFRVVNAIIIIGIDVNAMKNIK